MSFCILTHGRVASSTHNSILIHPTFYIVICPELHRIHNAQVYYNLDNQLPTSYPYQIQNYNLHPPHHNSCLHNLNLHTALTRAKPSTNLPTRLLSNQPQKKHSSKPLTVLSRPTCQVKSSSGNQTHSTVPTPASFVLSSFSANCISGI